MIKHIVCHKFINKSDAITAAKMLNALNGIVPSLRKMSAGVDVLCSGRSYDLGIVAEFDDLSGLAEYDSNPEHVKIKNFIASRKDNSRASVAVDFEF